MFTPIVFTLCIAVLGLASPTEKRQQMAQVVTQCTKPNTVALTFDDGPWIYLNDISKALKAANAVGTFFFNGNNYGCIYDAAEMERVKYVYGQGHQVASHTWAHRDLTKLSRDQINSEMQRVDDALKRIVGVVPAFMRPPYGNYNDLVRQVSYARGQKVAIWDFDSQDSIGATPAQSKKLYDDAISRHPSTILALNHEVYKTTAYEVLPYAISELQKAGYKLVSLADCLGVSPYQSIGSPGVPDSSWKC